MSTPQSVSNSTAEAVGDTGSPNQYHLHGHAIHISYYPAGAGPLTVDGPILLTYQDAHRSLAFREKQVQVVPVAGLGTCVTVTLEVTIDVGSTMATLLIPSVVLSPGQPTTIHTELITTAHNSALGGVGAPQRDHYTVTALTGEASQGVLPM